MQRESRPTKLVHQMFGGLEPISFRKVTITVLFIWNVRFVDYSGPGRSWRLLALTTSSDGTWGLHGNRVRDPEDARRPYMTASAPARARRTATPRNNEMRHKARKTEQPSSQGEPLHNVASTFCPTPIKNGEAPVYWDETQGGEFGLFFFSFWMYFQYLPSKQHNKGSWGFFVALKITSNNVPVPLHNPNNALSTVPGGFLWKKKTKTEKHPVKGGTGTCVHMFSC